MMMRTQFYEGNSINLSCFLCQNLAVFVRICWQETYRFPALGIPVNLFRNFMYLTCFRRFCVLETYNFS